MAKQLTSYVCQECGYDSPQWLGRCPECGNWNSLREIKLGKPTATGSKSSTLSTADKTPKRLSEINYTQTERIKTGFSELDSVFGGGIVAGSVTLIAGDPGVGKSTLLLQSALKIAQEKSSGSVLYISGEESEEQVKLRASRIAKKTTDNFLLLSISDTDAILDVISEAKPKLVIIDSIQTMQSQNVVGLSGSVPQVRYAAQQFIQLAKAENIPMIIVGHVTKEGTVAGPMVLSHMVDAVLFLEGEKITTTRILRSLKNRFGPVDEVGIFIMEGEGMKEATNPEQLFLSDTINQKVSGSVMVVTLEGTRAFLVEIQALVMTSKLAYPRRVASGIDAKRLELLLAVLQKQCKLPLDVADVFVNVAGGLKLSDPAVDLGVALAVYSSLKNFPMEKTVGIAEVGLLGELRKVPMLEKRIKEAKKLGFSKIITAEKFKTLGQVLKS